ncbi:13270_t:CDS:1 [Cetraspora pellucida]|uniref:13270_t:CDS:1 n=1 Tax=Cetraspora pellucida TaxID=1433469 RepID=A0ACA9NDG7_9GLOM|nr:13270_t:CDS:1 [Cetraspora pellucida]
MNRHLLNYFLVFFILFFITINTAVCFTAYGSTLAFKPTFKPTSKPTSALTFISTSIPTSTPTSTHTITLTSTPTSTTTSTYTSTYTSTPTSTPTLSPEELCCDTGGNGRNDKVDTNFVFYSAIVVNNNTRACCGVCYRTPECASWTLQYSDGVCILYSTNSTIGCNSQPAPQAFSTSGVVSCGYCKA